MRGKTHTQLLILIKHYLLTDRDMGLQKCTHQLHTKSSQLIQNPGLHIVYSSPRIMLSGPLCQMSLHERLLISKFFHFFLMGLILKIADSMGGRYDHIISQYRNFTLQ